VWPFFSDYRPNPPAFDGVPDGYQGLNYGDPIELGHRYAISMAFPQDPDPIGSSPSKASSFEIGRVYASSALAAVELANYIRALGYPARAHHLRNYGVLLVPVAVDSGLGELGRCGYLISKELGANFRLACVTTDLPLATDKPVDLGIQEFCEKCLKCAKNCPVRAIPTGDKVVVRGVEKWQLDAEKCLLYWGSQGGACAICQVVCPWSKPPTRFHSDHCSIVAPELLTTGRSGLIRGQRLRFHTDCGKMTRSGITFPLTPGGAVMGAGLSPYGVRPWWVFRRIG